MNGTNQLEAVEFATKLVLVSAGASDSELFFTVKECTTNNGSWRKGIPTGMYVIDLWGVRTNHGKYLRGEAAGRFRTTKKRCDP